jgi:DNA (cytosine-5)-methyltransferase 1
MLKTLGSEGYLIEWRVISAADYGFPQRRIRVFIVASKNATLATDAKVHVTKSGVLARALPVSTSTEFESIFRLDEDADVISENFNFGSSKSPFLNAGVFADGVVYTFKTKAAYAGPKHNLGDVVLSDDAIQPEYFVDPSRLKEWEYLKGAKNIERTHKASGTSYNYAEGKMAFPDLLTNPSRTILTGEGGTSPSRFKHIIKSESGYRRLAPIELERLNGFPDDWTATGSEGAPVSDARRAFFMGNALVVGLIERVGIVLARDLKADHIVS